MVYRAIGLMSGSSLDGLDIVFAEFHASGAQWSHQILHFDCIAYDSYWKQQLSQAHLLSAGDYLRLDAAYGHFIGSLVNQFIEKYHLEYQVHLISSHGHTVFHEPPAMTAQLGDGSAIAAATGINVVSDLRSMDVALGGAGAPIVPLGEQLLLGGYGYYLNLGGIANLSINNEPYTAYDICACNQVLNRLAGLKGLHYDEDGRLAASGKVDDVLLRQLNALEFYRTQGPKSLNNRFSEKEVLPLIEKAQLSPEDALRTYTEHVAIQVKEAVLASPAKNNTSSLLITGGGAFNNTLIENIRQHLYPAGVMVTIPEPALVQYKEALIMALLGILRLRQENTVLSSVTGSKRSSIGGALWMGQDA